MKAKWFIVIIIIETVLTGMFLVYALVQREQAIKAYELAEAAQQEAVAQADMASKLSLALSECNAKKK